MDFRALPPQCRQGIGRSHAGSDITYEGEILDPLCNDDATRLGW
jgi:hypothetical protein